MPDSDPSPSTLAAFRGPVNCRRTAAAVTLTGAAADSAGERLILTLIAAAADLPGTLGDVTVAEHAGHRYRIASGSRSWLVEATSVHVHRDVGEAFFHAIAPRPAPLRKRLFWAAVLALARSRAGKRLLLSLRRRA